MIEITLDDLHAFIQEALDAGGAHKATGTFVRIRCIECHTAMDGLDWRFARCPQCGPIDVRSGVHLMMRTLQ